MPQVVNCQEAEAVRGSPSGWGKRLAMRSFHIVASTRSPTEMNSPPPADTNRAKATAMADEGCARLSRATKVVPFRLSGETSSAA